MLLPFSLFTLLLFLNDFFTFHLFLDTYLMFLACIRFTVILSLDGFGFLSFPSCFVDTFRYFCLVYCSQWYYSSIAVFHFLIILGSFLCFCLSHCSKWYYPYMPFNVFSINTVQSDIIVIFLCSRCFVYWDTFSLYPKCES